MDIKEVATVITQYFNEVPLRTNSPVSGALEYLEKISLTDKLVGLYICGCPDGLNRLKEFANQSKRKAKIANEPEPKAKFAFTDLERFANHSEPESKTGSLKQVIADIETNNGKLTREQAMIAYCSGKKIRVMIDSCDDYDAWLVGQTPFVQFDNNDKRTGAIPLFVDNDYVFEIAPEPPKLVDGLTACRAYREGKKVRNKNGTYWIDEDRLERVSGSSISNHPNFTYDGWEIID